jgi:hypothetical protein
MVDMTDDGEIANAIGAEHSTSSVLVPEGAKAGAGTSGGCRTPG